MPDGPMPAQGAPAPEGGGAGGGIGEVIQDIDGKLTKIVEMAGGSGLPDEVKAAGAQALQAWRGFVEAAMTAAEGGGGAQGAQPVSPEAGAGGGAVPVNHGAR